MSYLVKALSSFSLHSDWSERSESALSRRIDLRPSADLHVDFCDVDTETGGSCEPEHLRTKRRRSDQEVRRPERDNSHRGERRRSMNRSVGVIRIRAAPSAQTLNI